MNLLIILFLINVSENCEKRPNRSQRYEVYNEVKQRKAEILSNLKPEKVFAFLKNKLND